MIEQVKILNIVWVRCISCNIFIVTVIPTSTKRNGGSGDFPSGSLLLNVLVIEGLLNSDNPNAKVAAKELASVLVKTIHKEFYTHHSMLENVIRR